MTEQEAAALTASAPVREHVARSDDRRIWTVEYATLALSIDVEADDEAEARAVAQAALTEIASDR